MSYRKPLILLALALLTLMLVTPACAETTSWQVNYQHVILDVQPNGQVDMTYEVDSVIQQGAWNEVWIPQTDPNQQVVGVVDGNGQNHTWRVGDSGGETWIMVQGFNLNPGDHVNLKIYSTLNSFVYSSDKAGYDIVTFTPPWWDMDISGTADNTGTQVKYYLPGNIPKDQVYTGEKLYDNFGTENNQTWVYFQSTHLSPNEQFTTAVSFPDSYMTAGAVTSGNYNGGTSYTNGGSGLGSVFGVIGGIISFMCASPIFFIVIIVILGFGFGQFGRSSYTSPTVSMDGIGINKSLDPAEAATLLRVDPKRVLTMIMFGMMKKGNIKLISTDPLRLELVSGQGLNYYEKLFADSIKNNALDEDGLLNCFKVLARRVVDKTRPYCRKDTEAYYKQKIDEAWAGIQAVDTPELKLQKYDTNMMWLMADEQFKQKTDTYVARAPGSDTVYVPPTYWWYPYYFGLPHHYGPSGAGTPQPRPQAGTPQPSGSKPTNATTASVETFANSISNSVEAMSAGVVGSVEKFVGVRNAANAPPASIPTFRGTGGGGSCACVSCACACVSCACACACAGGGHGCT